MGIWHKGVLAWGVLCGALSACIAQRPALLHLTEKDFEHRTQASTGQTTGTWCVLFTAEDQRVVNVVWERLAAAKLESEPSLLFGQVTYEDSPNLFKRFGLEHTQLPAARLFRTRKMHEYTGPNQPSPAMRTALDNFCSSTDLPAVDVPGAKSVWQESLAELSLGLHTHVDTLSASARWAIYAVAVLICMTLYVLIRGLFVRLPYERRESVHRKVS